MTTRKRKVLGTLASVVAIPVVLVAFSAIHARRVCDRIIKDELAPMPHYSTRLTLHPERHIADADGGLHAGWVVTYAPRSKNYGTSFFVALFGKIEGRGTPAIVATQRQEAENDIETFRQAFAQIDAAVQVGSSFSSVVTLLGPPVTAFTNQNGMIQAFYDYTPEAMLHTAVDLTNGFTLVVSNDVIVLKGHSYTSSR